MSVVILYFIVMRSAAISTLFPYTTLFRSIFLTFSCTAGIRVMPPTSTTALMSEAFSLASLSAFSHGAAVLRSEEHTSELQSQSNLVCRLLLEKKKSTRRRLLQAHARAGAA